MAGDVHDQLFSEKQLFASEVRGEDEDDENEVANGKDRASSSKSKDTVAPTGKASERRRKRAAERAKQIVYWLESKYDVLPQVCSSFENWKESTSANYDYDLLWSDTAVGAERFMKLKLYQKMNHFVGMSSITRKNNLGRNLLRMRKQFPKEYKFFPDTWILPTDLSDFKSQFTGAKNKTFIVKPDNGCQGKGIYLVRDVEKVPVDFTTTYVAQRYVHRPFLLDGFKFDLRLYVLVTGCDPLRIFIHKRGLVRLASEQYVEPTGKNLSQSMVHLTNYAINKFNPNFEENTDPDDAQDGHKRSWEAVQLYLRKEGHDVDTLLAEIEDLTVKTLIAVQPSLSHFYHSCQPEDVGNSMCFEVLGFDVIIDHKLQPWLLEVNSAPSFATESELDRMVKEEVLRDTMIMLDLTPETRRRKKQQAKEKMEQRSQGLAKKQPMEEKMYQEREHALQRTVWEEQNLNGYKKLYPTVEKEREYWQVHEAAINIWETLTGGTSRTPVRLSQPVELPDPAKKVASNSKRGSNTTDDNLPPKVEKRTAEELQKVVERLTAGCSSRPRKSSARRKDSKEEITPDTEEGPSEGLDGQSSTSWLVQSFQARQVDRAGRPEVQVGDVIKVQTNMGWEIVTVRAKRTTGKLDIQFKDGEYMRSVLPRILRDANGGPVAVQQEANLEGIADPPLLISVDSPQIPVPPSSREQHQMQQSLPPPIPTAACAAVFIPSRVSTGSKQWPPVNGTTNAQISSLQTLSHRSGSSSSRRRSTSHNKPAFSLADFVSPTALAQVQAERAVSLPTTIPFTLASAQNIPKIDESLFPHVNSSNEAEFESPQTPLSLFQQASTVKNEETCGTASGAATASVQPANASATFSQVAHRSSSGGYTELGTDCISQSSISASSTVLRGLGASSVVVAAATASLGTSIETRTSLRGSLQVPPPPPPGAPMTPSSISASQDVRLKKRLQHLINVRSIVVHSGSSRREHSGPAVLGSAANITRRTEATPFGDRLASGSRDASIPRKA